MCRLVHGRMDIIHWAGRIFRLNGSPASQSGKDCYDAIINKNLEALGAAFNECMLCWHTILPDIVEHPTLKIDLVALLEYYQSQYPGAMYSGCGGGYLYIASNQPVPGSFRIKVRIKNT